MASLHYFNPHTTNFRSCIISPNSKQN
ncbi:hypothetical protein E2C01_090750 [Portunus trituberculatus]|uniref:Uncharacterized protein n=1 Tax=Portunus trituberculatus TaxID=210409 RepID=A0A5B7JT88_PORTR|nr:hypothetical protein [Portunus trituberculatus]